MPPTTTIAIHSHCDTTDLPGVLSLVGLTVELTLSVTVVMLVKGVFTVGNGRMGGLTPQRLF